MSNDRHNPQRRDWIVRLIAGFVLFVLPVAFGYLLGPVGGVILGGLIWSAVGVFRWLDRALRYDGSAKAARLVGAIMIGACLGFVGGVIRSGPVGAG